MPNTEHWTVTNKAVPPIRRACGNCGRLGHNSATCTSSEKAHLKVGIEVEGYWLTDNVGAVDAKAEQWNMSGTPDGSLGRHDGYRSWEYRTRPGSLGEAVNQLIAIYPDATDAQVGMHVHVSFDTSDVVLLANQAFFDHFDSEWRAWATAKSLPSRHSFWNRLEGRNTYCKRPSMSEIPRRHVSGMDRYSQLNFASLSHHRTVECRLLPMFRDVSLAVSAVEKLIDIYESWLTGGGCDDYLSRQKRRAAVPTTPVKSKQFSSEVEITTEHKETWSHEVALYPEPSRQPGYQLLHAGTATRQLQTMGVL